MISRFTTIAGMLLIVSSAYGAEINVQKEISNTIFRVKQKLLIPQTAFFCKTDGSIEGSPWLEALTTCSLEARNIRQIGFDVSYSDVRPGPIPLSVVREIRRYRNCREVPIDIHDNISITTTTGHTISRNITITDNLNQINGTTFTIPVKAATLALNDQKQVNFSKQVSETEQYNYMTQEVRMEPVSYPLPDHGVPPNTLVTVIVKRTLSNAFIEFKGNIKIEADVFVAVRSKTTGELTSSPRLAGALSSLLPNDQDRIISLDGEVWNSSAAEVERTDFQESTVGTKACQTPALTVAGAGALDSAARDQLRSFLNAGTEIADTRSPGVSAALTTIPVISGMSISTADVIGNVSVRAKSMGPGLCAVTISSNTGAANFLAPPAVWSPWTVLYAHIGQSTSTISTSVGCDTGALFELQYYR